MFVKAQIAPVFFVMSLIGGPMAAQDTIPETPPELRDFRLDPQRPATVLPPTTEPQPTLPAPTEQPPQTTAPVQRESARARPRPPRETISRRNAPATAPPADAPAGPVPQVLEPVADISTDAAAATPDKTEASPATNIATDSDSPFWWTIAAALGVGIVLLGGIWLFRRRPPAHLQELAPSAEPASEDNHVATATIASPPAGAALPVRPSARPRLSLTFFPEKATLGFAALTVKGQLRLVNEGDAPANDMQLRASLLSASADQDKAIDAFHGGAFDISVKSLGDARPGEQIAMDIEMSVPVAELQSYAVGARRIFVPLVVANLAYGWDGGSDSARFACMVGREAQPPTPKMAPFRLDLGPRSFAPLGQRPLAL